MIRPAIVAPTFGIRFQDRREHGHGERIGEAQDRRGDAVHDPADDRDGEVAEHVARGHLNDPIGDLQVAVSGVLVEQGRDPVTRVREVDQPEERQEDHRQQKRDCAQRGHADLGHAAGHVAHPTGDLGRVLAQRVHRVAAAVDEVAETAVADLVDDSRQIVAEPANRPADRLRDHEPDHAQHGQDGQHQHRSAPTPAPARPSLHRVHHGREHRDAEHRHEDHEQDVRDRRQRPCHGNRGGDHQDGADRDRDLDPGALDAPGRRRDATRQLMSFHTQA